MRTPRFVGALPISVVIVLSCAGPPPEAPPSPRSADCRVPLPAECRTGSGRFGRFEDLPSTGGLKFVGGQDAGSTVQG